ncbi:MAG: hypothetical protein R3C26_16685 [Calditrichia bacterium]
MFTSSKILATVLLFIFAHVAMVQPVLQSGQAGGIHANCDCGCDENSTSCCCSPTTLDEGVSIRACGTGFPSFNIANFGSCVIQPYFQVKQIVEDTTSFNCIHFFIDSPEFLIPIEHPPEIAIYS